MERDEDGRLVLSDGYRYTGPPPSMEIVLIDPEWCPAPPDGHPFDGVRRSHINCQQHGDLHHEWTCACGQRVWRFEGAFVDRLPCR